MNVTRNATQRGEDVPSSTANRISFRDAFWMWCRVAALSFGGPAGQIAVMHRIVVDEKKLISEARFLHALNYCMLLPGPEAQQLAIYIGWLLHRTLGGVVAGTLFVLPGAVAMLALSALYAEHRDATMVQALFFGLKPAVIAVVFEAVLRIGRRVLKNRALLAVAAVSFLAIRTLDVPFPFVILAAAVIGLCGRLWRPDWFHGTRSGDEAEREHTAPPPPPARCIDLWRRSVVVTLIFLSLWFGPLLAVRSTLGAESIYFQEGVFFSQAALVTFGGAYSVLAYIGQQAVESYAWLKPGEMLDGLGMAETTPGPLIIVVQFVGFMAAYRQPGPFAPMTAGILGSLITLWVTFVPSFFWILLGAPFVERLRGNRCLDASLSAVTASVVGVILSLAIWFATQTLFTSVNAWRWGLLNVDAPDFATLDWRSALITLTACWLLLIRKRGLAVTLVVSALMGYALYFTGR